jgi:alpha-amylase
MKKIGLLVSSILLCNLAIAQDLRIHNQNNIYEVNIRQITPEGTFKAFEQHLTRLKEMGVKTLWFMPIYPISVKDRKGTLGSYYAIQDYKKINPQFGTLQDWKHLVNEAHKKGFFVIIDWVANHTGADHQWLQTHPAFYVQDSITHQPIAPFDWTDVRKLNYSNYELRDSMSASLQYWIKETNIDGFRCDVAAEVPASFWRKAISGLRNSVKKPLFFLAEAEDTAIYNAGFDACYMWSSFTIMKDIVLGKKNAIDLKNNMLGSNKLFGKKLQMYFTSNHDENCWNKADFGTMPGAIHEVFAALTFTLPNTIPLIYNGQEEPTNKAISFFEKDTIVINKLQRASFYKKMINIRKNPLFSNNAQFDYYTFDNKNLLGFERTIGVHKLIVIANLSSQTISGNYPIVINNQYRNLKTNKPITTIKNTYQLGPWDYLIYYK